MYITRNLRRWGNSSAVRLPKNIIDAANWHRNQELQVILYRNLVILAPVKRKNQATLKQILKDFAKLEKL